MEIRESLIPPKYISRSINQLPEYRRLGGLTSWYSGMKGECDLSLLGWFSRNRREVGSFAPTQKAYLADFAAKF